MGKLQLTSAGLSLKHRFVQAHGLFDEASYANWNDARLLACDSPLWSAESLVTGDSDSEVTGTDVSLSHATLQRRAIRSIEASGLALIATLSPSEVIQLRQEGEEVFRILDYVSESGVTTDGITDIRDGYLDAVTGYWDRVCTYLRRTRPGLAQRRTKIGVFTRDKLPGFSRWSSKYISLTVNLGVDLLAIALPALSRLGPDALKRLVDSLSFRFIFFTDSSAMAQLRRAMPAVSWLSRQQPDVIGQVLSATSGRRMQSGSGSGPNLRGLRSCLASGV